jgi:NADPH:quinone reductase-like Zn-dependent oxidoreductase
MRQVWITKTGGPEVLQVREAPDPEPGPDQVRVRVAASGINFADLMARMGLYPDAPKIPCVVGYEVSGTVDKLGPGVDGPAVGTRVVAATRFGGYSDVVVVPASQASPIPEGLSFEKAAAIPVNYLTAWLMLVRMGNVQNTDTVLVHSAAGGVGQAALQICRRAGATVIGTASPSKHERLKSLGVAHCIDSGTADLLSEVKRLTGGKGVEIVLDAVGGKSIETSYRCLGTLGRVYCFGASSFAPKGARSLLAVIGGMLSMPRFNPLGLMDKNRGVMGINLGHMVDRPDILTPAMQEVLRLVGDGTFDPVVDKTFPFDKAGDAHQFIADRKNFGKVLLVP